MEKLIVNLMMVVLGLVTSTAFGDTLLYDHFDDQHLDDAWKITTEYALGWEYSENESFLDVTDIIPSIINRGSGGSWSRVAMSRSFPAAHDFEVQFDFEWDSQGTNRAMQFLYISLYDLNHDCIISSGYCDPWVSYSGRQEARIGDASFTSSLGSLPLSGSASIRLQRTDGIVKVFWDNVELLSGEAEQIVDKARISFGYYAYAKYGSTSVFGTLSPDMICVTSSEIDWHAVATTAVSRALQCKQNALEQVENAVAEETKARDALDNLLINTKPDKSNRDKINKAQTEIKFALKKQEKVLEKLNMAINELEKALARLVGETEISSSSD